MKKLSSAAQGKAVAFLKSEGRSLEQKLYAYHFENGPTTDVLTTLEAFQNPDCGFGQAFRPQNAPLCVGAECGQSYRTTLVRDPSPSFQP